MMYKRNGLKDAWNGFMCEGASFTKNDIPRCPTTADHIPNDIITWEEAKAIYKRHIERKQHSFKYDAFVCFYMDDYKFDGVRGIWHNSTFALKVLKHFDGVITPDFSTYQDFPDPIKLYNTFRMRAFGYWLGTNGLSVINNVRWGTFETFEYSFDAIDSDSIIAIGTCGGSPRKHEDRERFNRGFNVMLQVLRPKVIVVYGSADYPCFEKAKLNGVQVVSFPSKTAKAFERRRNYE